MNRLEKLLGYIADRLAERSTWEGIAAFAVLFGYHSQALDLNQCASIGVALAGAVRIIFPDANPPKE